MVPAIRTRGLSKFYGRTRGIEDLALEVHSGEIFGFLGANGAGKTTTIRLLMGLLLPSRGSAEVLGLDVWRDGLRARTRTGYLPGELRLYPHLTGGQLLERLGALYPSEPSLRGPLLERLGLTGEALGRKARTYSHGMKEKLGLVLAMEHDPELVVLDEPTVGLDPVVRVELKGILREARDRGRTIFYSTHDLDEAQEMCDRVGILRAGRLVAVEEVGALAARRTHQVEAELAEAAPIEALRALPGVTVLDSGAHHVRLRITGELGPLLRILADARPVQLEIRGPDLEDLFLEHYR